MRFIWFLDLNIVTGRPIESLAGALLAPSSIVGYAMLTAWCINYL